MGVFPSSYPPMPQRRLTLTPTPPYNFRLSMEHMASFGTGARANIFQNGVYHRLLNLNDNLILTQTRSTGTIDNPSLQATIHADEIPDQTLNAVRDTLTRILGIHTPLAEFYAAANHDPVLAPIVKQLYGLKISQTPTVFEAFVQSIFSQQIATNVARIIGSLLLQNYGQTLTHEGRAYHAFPTPTAILADGIPGLRAIKLSTRKAEYILDVAAAIADGSLDLEGLRHLPDDEATKRLLALRGVGPWTTHWLLLRALGRLDAFPSGDLALRRVVSRLYLNGQTLTVPQLEQYSQQWRPYRSLHTTYLFAALRRNLLPPNTLTP